jgi:hypothetical protein
MENKNNLNGLSIRHVKQIIRRSMITRTKPNKKEYDRKRNKKDFES